MNSYRVSIADSTNTLACGTPDVNDFVYFKLLPFIELDHHRAHFSFLIKMNQHGNVFFNSIRHKKSPPEIAYRMHCMVILGVDFT